MKKVYKIQITDSNNHPHIWYAKRIGQEFEAELSIYYGGYVVYAINGKMCVHPEDCQVIGVREVERYHKKEKQKV